MDPEWVLDLDLPAFDALVDQAQNVDAKQQLTDVYLMRAAQHAEGQDWKRSSRHCSAMQGQQNNSWTART